MKGLNYALKSEFGKARNEKENMKDTERKEVEWLVDVGPGWGPDATGNV